MSSFLCLNLVNDETKCLIFGYVRNHEKECIKYNIPSAICQLIVWYYWERERFAICGPQMQINETGDILTSIHDVRNAAYGEISIDMKQRAIYYWKLKIIAHQHTNWSMYIGITSQNTNLLYCYKDPGIYYLYKSKATLIWNDGFSAKRIEYGKKYGSRDVIEMEINTVLRQISFCYNHEKQGIAFTDILEEYQYYLAVSFRGGNNNAVQILTFDKKSW